MGNPVSGHLCAESVPAPAQYTPVLSGGLEVTGLSAVVTAKRQAATRNTEDGVARANTGITEQVTFDKQVISIGRPPLHTCNPVGGH